MLAYAAHQPQVAARRSNPKVLLLVVGAHLAAVAILLTMKPEIAQQITRSPIVVNLIRENPPPPNPVKTPPPRAVDRTEATQLPRQIVTPPIQPPAIGPTPSLPNINDLLRPPMPPQPRIEPQPLPTPSPPTIARLLTAPSELKPPYPQAKLMTGEEATLNLRLSIDEGGHVVAVDPIGYADRVFLTAARQYVIAHWRYQPATRDGHAVPSTVTVTLRFELD